MMKVYKAVHERENKCKELHKEMNMNVGPTRLVQPDFYLLVDVDDLQKQANTLENEVHRMKRAEARGKRQPMHGVREKTHWYLERYARKPALIRASL